MALTSTQIQVLSSAIAAETDPTFVALRTANDEQGMADWYNAPSDPAFILWRSSVTRAEILQNGFDWTRLDNLSVGKARVWSDIFVDGTINPSKPNVRTGIDSVWFGSQADLAVRAAIYVHCKRTASRIEKPFATGVGSGASPGNAGFEGSINAQDISDALRV